MHIAITADLHWEIPLGHDATRKMAEALLALNPDIFVVAGDIGEGAAFAECLSVFSGLNSLKLLVPGNHDLFSKDPLVTSCELYESILPVVATNCNFGYLDDAPYVFPDTHTAVLGCMNWFDMTFIARERLANDPNLAAECFAPGSRDSEISLGMSDAQFANRIVDRFETQLRALPASVQEIVVIAHFPPAHLMVLGREPRTPQGYRWVGRCGNVRMERLVLDDNRITTIVCGHTHDVTDLLPTLIPGKRCFNIGGDSSRKRLLLLDTDNDTHQWREFSADA